ncbi:dirigent protein [Streptomyces sp. N2-109]|uniref:Dirigent protein n=1 Tax=Streptomyces gossypii TaxID=2883101 RepID=A0ABT2JPR9_9ACTN|nr:dirigent protein [Streptomyces gossypii]MCT2589728.1 dirigent protein [Streptomyces gossypii]
MMKTGRQRMRHAALATGAAVVVSLTLSGGGPPGGRQDHTQAPAPPTVSKDGGSQAKDAPVRGGRTIRVTANLQVGEELDLGAQGRSVGDQFVFSGNLRSRPGDRPVGRFGGFCVINDLQRNAGECSLTAVLEGGQIAVQGEQAGIPTPSPVTNAITGGTGKFRNAHGQMTLRVLTASTWELTFHVTGH